MKTTKKVLLNVLKLGFTAGILFFLYNKGMLVPAQVEAMIRCSKAAPDASDKIYSLDEIR